MNENEMENHEASEFAERVQEQVDEGKVDKARRIVSRSWREAVPELPQRFPVILSHPDKERVARMVKKIRSGGDIPELKMVLRGKKAKITSKSGKRIGDLSARDRDFLKSLGKAARLYEPRLLEIKSDDDGKLSSVAVELVRPEVSVCPECESYHPGIHVLCDDCRAGLSRSAKKSEPEPAPVEFHDAVAAIIAEPEDEPELKL